MFICSTLARMYHGEIVACKWLCSGCRFTCYCSKECQVKTFHRGSTVDMYWVYCVHTLNLSEFGPIGTITAKWILFLSIFTIIPVLYETYI